MARGSTTGSNRPERVLDVARDGLGAGEQAVGTLEGAAGAVVPGCGRWGGARVGGVELPEQSPERLGLHARIEAHGAPHERREGALHELVGHRRDPLADALGGLTLGHPAIEEVEGDADLAVEPRLADRYAPGEARVALPCRGEVGGGVLAAAEAVEVRRRPQPSAYHLDGEEVRESSLARQRERRAADGRGIGGLAAGGDADQSEGSGQDGDRAPAGVGVPGRVQAAGRSAVRRSARGTTSRMPERSSSIEHVLLSIRPISRARGTSVIWSR